MRTEGHGPDTLFQHASLGAIADEDKDVLRPTDLRERLQEESGLFPADQLSDEDESMSTRLLVAGPNGTRAICDVLYIDGVESTMDALGGDTETLESVRCIGTWDDDRVERTHE